MILLSLILSLLLQLISSQCIHDTIVRNAPKHFYNDAILGENRLLQTQQVGQMRIFVDYSQVTVGTIQQINYIKRICNITANYFYNVLKVQRLDRLFFPKDTPLLCNSVTIPQIYATEGIIGDMGIVVGNQNRQEVSYIAKSYPCAYLLSNKRPIWGMIQFNNAFLKVEQHTFQDTLFVAIHQFTHNLGFSTAMYELYPSGNPVKNLSGDYFLSSPKINAEILAQYGCNDGRGMPLEDQDGQLISSHWQRKVIGSQYMISSSKKNSYISRITLSLFQSTGWYPEVSYALAQPSTWGRNRGCSFLNIDDCTGSQFCTDTSTFSCDWDGTGQGKCNVDIFAGSCKLVKYFTNTICTDPAFQLKNLNSQLQAYQRGGANSRCFQSTLRSFNKTLTLLNTRCYISVCSLSGNYIYILVLNYILVCRFSGQVITGIPGLDGDLVCPLSFNNYCQNKKTCAFHCNTNGACFNGQCLCTGNIFLTPTCLDVSILLAPVGTTGGLLSSKDVTSQRTTVQSYSLNSKCFSGYIFQKQFGQCVSCKSKFNCENCNENGCISCDDGGAPVNGICAV